MEDLELEDFDLDDLDADEIEPESDDEDTAIEMELLLGRVQAARFCGA